MTQFLPPNLLVLFAPGPPLPYIPPADKLREEKNSNPYTGVASFLSNFEDPKETPAPVRGETREERRERKKKERAEQAAYKLEQDIALWNPTHSENARGDPFKTLFVARINFDTSESKLKREFEDYGAVKKVTLVKNKMNGKPKGYAYIEFEKERDMIDAYKKADGRKIDGKRILVDVERGRTVKGWRPRRLGGGLGNTRRGGSQDNTKLSGRNDPDTRESSKMLVDDRDRNARDEKRSRSRDRNRRSRERDRRRRTSRERKRSPEREVKREPGEHGNDRRRERRSSRERRRSRSTERKRKRSRSRSRGKKERVKQVKEEMVGGYEGYPYGGIVPPPPQNMFVKREQYNQDVYNNQAPPPPVPPPSQGNPYPPPNEY